MPIYQIKGSAEGLAASISGDAKAFGFSPRSLAERLKIVAVTGRAAAGRGRLLDHRGARRRR